MCTEHVDSRLRLLKDAHRLPPPFDSIVVYDREGSLGFRLLSHIGPTESGIEIDYSEPFKLKAGETPIDCYRAMRIVGMPNRNDWSTRADLRGDCGAKFVSWKRGSHAGLTADVRSIVCAAAARFSAVIFDGYLMFAFLSETESSPALTPIDRAAYLFSGSVCKVTEAGARWLIEDIARLARGLFSRNLPVGCGSDYGHQHTHQAIRVTVLVGFNGSSSALDTMESAARYEDIVAAAQNLAPRRARMGLSTIMGGAFLS